MTQISILKNILASFVVLLPALAYANTHLDCDPKVVLRDGTGIERPVRVYTFDNYLLSLNKAPSSILPSEKISFDLTKLIESGAISQPRILAVAGMDGNLVFRTWFEKDLSNPENSKVTGISLNHVQTKRDGNHIEDWAYSFVSTDLAKDGQTVKFELLSTKGNLGIARVSCTLHSTD